MHSLVNAFPRDGINRHGGHVVRRACLCFSPSARPFCLRRPHHLSPGTREERLMRNCSQRHLDLPARRVIRSCRRVWARSSCSRGRSRRGLPRRRVMHHDAIQFKDARANLLLTWGLRPSIRSVTQSDFAGRWTGGRRKATCWRIGRPAVTMFETAAGFFVHPQLRCDGSQASPRSDEGKNVANEFLPSDKPAMPVMGNVGVVLRPRSERTTSYGT